VRAVLAAALVLAVAAGLGASCAAGREKEAGAGTGPGGAGSGASASGAGGAGGTGGAGGSGGHAGAEAEGGAGGAPPDCTELPCKLVLPQCGCPDGAQCSIVDASSIQCVPAGDKADGAPCGFSVNECKPGYICLNNLTGAGGLCHRFCKSDTDCAAPGGLCVMNPGASQKACSQNCDPVTATGCPDAMLTKCDLAKDNVSMKWFSRCTGKGTKQQGEECGGGPSQCDKGMSCFNVTDQAMMVTKQLCLTWCVVGGAVGCPPNSQCSQLNPPVTLGSIQYGACVPFAI
jgi:hypothetical protein